MEWTIREYQVGTGDIDADIYKDIRVDIHQGAKILCVGSQEGVPYIWALVDIDAPLESQCFYFVLTDEGPFISDVYVGTVFCGIEPWHIFMHTDERVHINP